MTRRMIPDQYRIWRWPILSLVLGVALLPLLAVPVVKSWRAVEASRAPSCSSHATHDCVTRVEGDLEEGDGRNHRRQMFPIWSLTVGGSRIDSFEVSGPTSDQLQTWERAPVTARMWHGEVISLRPSSGGGYARTTYAGWRGMGRDWAGLAFGVFIITSMIVRALARRGEHGWMSTTSDGDIPAASVNWWLYWIAAAPALSALGTMLGVRFTDSQPATILLSALGLALGVFLAVRSRATGKGEHVRSGG